jgi:hypothetical protein
LGAVLFVPLPAAGKNIALTVWNGWGAALNSSPTHSQDARKYSEIWEFNFILDPKHLHVSRATGLYQWNVERAAPIRQLVDGVANKQPQRL